MTPCGKRCSTCGAEKVPEAFTKKRGVPASQCRACHAEAERGRRKRLGARGRRDARAYYAKNAPDIQTRRRRCEQRDPAKYHFYSLVSNCRKQGEPCFLTLEDVRAMWTDNCPVCNCDLQFRKGPRNQLRSIDRLDPTGGYSKENCAIICYRCNRIKQDASPAELRRLASWVEAEIEKRGI